MPLPVIIALTADSARVGFAQVFSPHSGQVNFVLLDFFLLACSGAGIDCQWSAKPCAASFAYALARSL